MISLQPIRPFLKPLPLILAAASLLSGCVVVEPHHHHPAYRPAYSEPAPHHRR